MCLYQAKLIDNRVNSWQTDFERSYYNPFSKFRCLIIMFCVILPGAGDNLSEARSRLFLRAQQRTIRMAAAIFAVFVINWAPYSVASLWYLWVPGEHEDNHLIFEFCFLFGLSNSCFNPMIYGICNIQHVNYLLRCCGIRIGDDSARSASDRKTSTYYVRGNHATKTSFAPRSVARVDNHNNCHAGGRTIPMTDVTTTTHQI